MSDNTEMDAAFEAYRARTFGTYASYPLQSCTDFCAGWKAARGQEDTVLVPSAPTKAMLRAAQRAHADHGSHREWLSEEWPYLKEIWDAMLKAARRGGVSGGRGGTAA